MKVLKEDSELGKKLNMLEEFLKANNIRINKIGSITIDKQCFKIVDMGGYPNQYSYLPRIYNNEKFVVIE